MNGLKPELRTCAKEPRSTPVTNLVIGRGGAAGFLGGGQGGLRGAAAAADGGEGSDAGAKARQVVRPQPLSGERVEAVQIAVHADDQPVPIQQQRDITRLRCLPLPHQLPGFPMNGGDAFVEAGEDKVGEFHGTPMLTAMPPPARETSRFAVRGSRIRPRPPTRTRPRSSRSRSHPIHFYTARDWKDAEVRVSRFPVSSDSSSYSSSSSRFSGSFRLRVLRTPIRVQWLLSSIVYRLFPSPAPSEFPGIDNKRWTIAAGQLLGRFLVRGSRFAVRGFIRLLLLLFLLLPVRAVVSLVARCSSLVARRSSLVALRSSPLAACRR